jgi:hypothetical protein
VQRGSQLPTTINRIARRLDPAAFEREGKGERAMLTRSAIADWRNLALLDRGRLIGRWVVDPERASIVKTTCGVKDQALDAKVKETEVFVRDDLGEARSFSLDRPPSRVLRIEWLRQVQR